MSYIGAEELVFNNDVKNSIHTGGFNVNSILMKKGISPIMTMNSPTEQKGGFKNVSDIFNSLVVPNWALSYHNKMVGGEYKEHDSDADSDEEDDIVDDNLHDKLLDLVKEHEKTVKLQNKKATKRQLKTKKNKTKKHKKKL